MKKTFLFLIAIPFFSMAQSKDSVTLGDYQRAESLLAPTVNRLVDNPSLTANWLDGNRFWFAKKEKGVTGYFLQDRKSSRSILNMDKLAAALSKQTGKKVSPKELNLFGMNFSSDLKEASFFTDGSSWKYNIGGGALTKGSDTGQTRRSFSFNANVGISPDGTKRAFIKDDNLWIQEVKTGKEYALTTDGVKDFGYATDNAGWKHSDNPILLWSKDSKMIATFQQDQRKVGDMYLVTTNVGHPKLEQWKYPLPGDKDVIMIHRVVIKVDPQNPQVIRLKTPADFHRATLGDDITNGGDILSDTQFDDDLKTLAFVSTSRDHKEEQFKIADLATGDVRTVFTETVPTQFESGQTGISWRYLSNSNEILWYSERDNYGHLYLYDATTGKLKNKVTDGTYVVANVLKTDEKDKKIYFTAVDIDPKNPYFQHFCVIDFDGKGFKDLTPETGNHQISLSPSGEYFVNSYSQLDVPPVFNLRDIRGNKVADLGLTDISRLEATGWKPATPIVVKSADGKYELYGLMFTPTNLDPNKKYPVVDYIYPGPQGGSVGYWGFVAARGDHQALADLGFVVVLIEGTGNPQRTKAFHDESYGHMSINTLPDQVSGLKQLAQKYSFMDLNRVGMWGHSGGGFATADAMFTYPDFFKVGIAESGNHDNRNYEDDWGERYIGLEKMNANGTSNYTDQANEVHAKNLKGKLLLAHGLMDDNVPPSNTLLVVQALEEANKDFDLIVFPNSHHGYGPFSNYMMRRRWDYFVTNLKGALHPKEFKIGR